MQAVELGDGDIIPLEHGLAPVAREVRDLPRARVEQLPRVDLVEHRPERGQEARAEPVEVPVPLEVVVELVVEPVWVGGAPVVVVL